MSVSVKAKNGLTAEELLGIPDKGKRRELVEGELRKMPPAGSVHGAFGGRLQAYLGVHILNHQFTA